MAKKKTMEELLRGLGLGGSYSALVANAIQEDWTETEFLTRLVHTGQFRRTFPGLMQGGQLAPLLSPIPSAFTASNLGSAIRNYYSIENAYQQVARNYGKPFGRQQVALLIRGQVSPDELGARVQAVQSVKSNPALREQFNTILRDAGEKPLDEHGFFRFVAKAAPRKFYDIYEAAQLRALGLELTPGQARTAAQQIGAIGAPADIAGIVREIKLLKPDIGPELRAAGITDQDLVLLQAGQDPRNLEPALRRIVAQRRATGSFVPGYQPRTGTAGGVAIFGREEALAD